MTKRRKLYSPFVYALLVWLTSVLLGAPEWAFIVAQTDTLLSRIVDNVVLLTFLAFIYSLPFPLLLWPVVRLIDRRDWRKRAKKFRTWIILLAMMLILVSAVCYWDESSFDRWIFYICGIYALPLLAGVLMWKWPGRGSEGETRERAAG